MLVYSIMITLSLILAAIYDKVGNKDKTKVAILIFLILFINMGFRYDVGQDYFFTYVPIYKKIYMGMNTGIEWGYALLNKICIFFAGDNFQSIFILTAIIFLGFIIAACRKNKASMLLMMYIFLCGGFYFYSLNVTRQCIAIAIFFYSIRYIICKEDEQKIINRNLIMYILLISLGITLHNSALIYLPLYFILDKDCKKIRYLQILICVLIITPLIVNFLEIILEGTKYGNYISGHYADTTKKINVSQILNVIVFICYYIAKPQEKDKSFIVYRNVHFIGVLFTCLMGSVPLVFRMTTMFYLIQFLSVPYYYKYYVSKKYKLLFLLGILGIYMLLLTNIFITNGNKILPYQFNI